MGWRYALRWCVRERRFWTSAGAVVVATAMAATDRRAGWTETVAVVTTVLAVLAVRGRYLDEHPDLAERRAARQRTEVDRVLARHEASRRPVRPAPRPPGAPRRLTRREARHEAEVAKILARYEQSRGRR